MIVLSKTWSHFAGKQPYLSASQDFLHSCLASKDTLQCTPGLFASLQ